MDVKDEIGKTQDMVKKAGFKLLDVQFEGVVEAGNDKVLSVLQKMASEQQAVGVVRVFYEANKDVRVIEIPIGNLPEK